MAATELNNRPAVEETSAQELSARVAQQVSEILEEAAERDPVPVPVRIRQPELAYRVPSPGVRYYF